MAEIGISAIDLPK